MMTHPTTEELLQAVIAWLGAPDAAARRDSYMALVARNALGIVLRESQHGAAAAAGAQIRLEKLLHMQGDLPTLEAELCNRIRTGAIAVGDPALLAHLRADVAARLRIDQPRYSASALRCKSSLVLSFKKELLFEKRSKNFC